MHLGKNSVNTQAGNTNKKNVYKKKKIAHSHFSMLGKAQSIYTRARNDLNVEL